MNQLFSSWQRRMDNYVAYRRLVNELSSLPTDIALDLDIYPGDAKKIAAKAIYG